ncbi:hypothetical protein FRB99_007714 [Tulasnella sp. 403]|nr:hypothetical protein FRB99_007714 [Tulasnella sp. 403]
MDRNHVEVDSEDAEFLRLRQLGKDAHVRISDTPLDLEGWPGRVSLFAISNRTGYFVAGLNDAFVVAPIQGLRGAFDSEASYRPQYTTPLPSRPIIVKFTSDGDRIVVCTRDGRVFVYGTPRNASAWNPESTNPLPALSPFHEFTHSSLPIRDVHPNPSDRPETVAILRGGDSSGSLVEILDTKESKVLGSIPAESGPSFQTAISWSPKGKQIAVGNKGGQVLQFAADGSQKASIPPADDSKQQEVVSVFWLEPTVFIVTYRNPEEEHEYAPYIIIHDARAGKITDILLRDDPTSPWGLTSRESARSYVHLKSWQPTKHLLLVTDAPADEIGVVACFEGSNPRWTKLDLDDTARATLPMGDDGPSTLIGFDLDLTSTTSISTSTQFGDDSPPLPPAPIVFGYTNEGIVLAYHVLNSQTPVYPGMMPFDPSAVPSTPPRPTDPRLNQTTPVTTTPPVAQSTTPGTPPVKPAFGQPTFGQPAFGQSTFGQSTFGTTTPTGTPSKPPSFGQTGFGQTSSFGGGSPIPAFGQTSFGAAANKPAFGQPAFGQTGFGATPSTSPTATFGAPAAGTGFSAFSAKPATFGSTGFGFGAVASPAPAFGSTGFSGFGAPSGTPTAPAPSSTGGFSAFASSSKSSSIAPGTGAFGSFASGTSSSSAAEAAKKEEKPLAFAAAPATKPAEPTAKPVFGATTSFGGFGSGGFGGSFGASKAATPAPVNVGKGGAFGGFTGASGFSAFAAKSDSSTSFGDLLGSGGDIKAPPATSTSETSKGASLPKISIAKHTSNLRAVNRDGEDDDEDDGKKETTSTKKSLADEIDKRDSDEEEPPKPRSRERAASPPPSAFSMMSLGTARPSEASYTAANTPSIFNSMSLSTTPRLSTTPKPPPSAAFSAFSGYPMSTSTDFDRSPSDTATEVNRGKDDDDKGSDGDEKEDEDADADADAEGKDSDDDFVLSAPLSPVTEERDTEDEDTSNANDGSYVMAQPPSPPADETTTPRGTPKKSDSTTPEGTPERSEESVVKPRSASPTPPPASSRSSSSSPSSNLNIPTQTPPVVRPFGGRGPFSAAPAVSSPLAAPPISGPSPSKTDKESEAATEDVEESPSNRKLAQQQGKDQSDVEESPTKPRAKQGEGAKVPLPSEDESKSRPPPPKTPPLGFGLFGSGPRSRGQSTSSTTPAPTPTNVFGGSTTPIPTPAPPNLFANAANTKPVTSNIFGAASGPSPVKPVFGTPTFSFGGKSTSAQPATTPAQAPSTGIKPPTLGGFASFANPAVTTTSSKPAAPVFGGFGSMAPPTSGGLFGVTPSSNATLARKETGASGLGGLPGKPPAQAARTPTPPTTSATAPATSANLSIRIRGPVPSPGPAPPPPNALEGQFKQVIDEIQLELAHLVIAVEEAKREHVKLVGGGRRVPLDARGRDYLDQPAAWSFSDLSAVQVVAGGFREEVEVVDAIHKEMKRIIAVIHGLAPKLETRQAEIRRFSQGRDDPEVAAMIRERQLGPEQEANQIRLRRLCESVGKSVEQLEVFVEGEKRRLDQAKAGKHPIQPPPLESITRSMARMKATANLRLQELTDLEQRLAALNLEEVDPQGDQIYMSPEGTKPTLTPEPRTAQLLATTQERLSSSMASVGLVRRSSAMSSTSTGRKVSRAPSDPVVAAAAAAALNSEGSSQRLRDALFQVRSEMGGETPWNKTVYETEKKGRGPIVDERVMYGLKRTRTKNYASLPAWAKPEQEGLRRATTTSGLVSPLVKKNSEGSIPSNVRNDVPSFSFEAQVGKGGRLNRLSMGPGPLVSTVSLPNLGKGGPVRMKPLPKAQPSPIPPATSRVGRRGYGLPPDVDDD